MKQNDYIAEHLKHKNITPIEALNLYGCFRLGARIYELRQKGYDIKTNYITEGNKTYASYELR